MAVRLSTLSAGCLLPPRMMPGAHFCWRLSRPQGHSTAGRIKSIKNSNYFIGNRTRDLAACSVVPQTTPLPRAQYEFEWKGKETKKRRNGRIGRKWIEEKVGDCRRKEEGGREGKCRRETEGEQKFRINTKRWRKKESRKEGERRNRKRLKNYFRKKMKKNIGRKCKR
jgi:hypothetical protein